MDLNKKNRKKDCGKSVKKCEICEIENELNSVKRCDYSANSEKNQADIIASMNVGEHDNVTSSYSDGVLLAVSSGEPSEVSQCDCGGGVVSTVVEPSKVSQCDCGGGVVSTVGEHDNLTATDCSSVDESLKGATSDNGELKHKKARRSFFSTKELAYCAVFVVLIIIGAFIKIPIPYVPITFQVTFVTMAGLILGAKLGTLSVVVYVIMGLCGIPIFSGGGGLGYVMQPSFGYIIGFVFGVFVTGVLAYLPRPKNTYLRHLLAGIAGLLVVYFIGCLYLYFIINYALGATISVSKVIISYFLILFPKDVALVAIGSIASFRLQPYLAKQGFHPELIRKKTK